MKKLSHSELKNVKGGGCIYQPICTLSWCGSCSLYTSGSSGSSGSSGYSGGGGGGSTYPNYYGYGPGYPPSPYTP